VQTGLGRTGRLLASEHEGVRPDGVIIGKALGGGLLPVSAFLADEALMQVFGPGDHGSTFGGNPLACNVAMTALDLLEEGLVENAARLGELLLVRLHQLTERSSVVRAVRGRGLFAGIEVDTQRLDAHRLAEVLLDYGVLTMDTHHTVLRLAPPLVISQEELEWGLGRIGEALNMF
jgi:ornithine--oxo-acid transaminase